MKRVWISLALLTACSLKAAGEERGPPGYRALYATDFTGGLDPRINQQRPTDISLMIVDSPGGRGGKCLRVTMRRSDDFSKVANGAPRSELSFGGQFRLKEGADYLLAWSTFIPVEHRFDSQQPESIAQIHQSLRTGSPPFLLMLGDRQYQVDIRGGRADHLIKTGRSLGSAEGDLGKWVHWRLHYIADSTGSAAVLRLFKNGALVLDASGKPNAYANDQDAYLKVGIYKWAWKKSASDVEIRTLFYDDISAAVKQ